MSLLTILASALSFLATLLFPVSFTFAQTHAFRFTGSMNVARFEHTATLVPTGKALVAGGSGLSQGANALASAELYDRSTGFWTFTGAMNTPRKTHKATLLNNGKVLVTGGFDLQDNRLASAELYDPVTGTWTTTGSMSFPRDAGHTATLLSSGKVLVAGGRPNSSTITASAEIYDPNAGTFKLDRGVVPLLAPPLRGSTFDTVKFCLLAPHHACRIRARNY